MRKACGDEKTAKWLEENLAIMPDVIRNAQKAARFKHFIWKERFKGHEPADYIPV